MTYEIYEVIEGLEKEYHYHKTYTNTKYLTEYKMNKLLTEKEEKFHKTMMSG